MDDRVRHPRLLAAFRVALYLTAGAVAVGAGVLAVATIGFVVGVGGVALLLTGEAHLLAVALLSALVVATTGGLVGALAVAARRVDREVTDADRSPHPVERAKQRYVDGHLDEAELEHRLERLLGTGGAPDASAREQPNPSDRTTPSEQPTRGDGPADVPRSARERAGVDGGD